MSSPYRQASKPTLSLEEIWPMFWARSLTHKELKGFYKKMKAGELPGMPARYQDAVSEEYLAREAICWTGRPTTPLEDM